MFLRNCRILFLLIVLFAQLLNGFANPRCISVEPKFEVLAGSTACFALLYRPLKPSYLRDTLCFTYCPVGEPCGGECLYTPNHTRFLVPVVWVLVYLA